MSYNPGGRNNSRGGYRGGGRGGRNSNRGGGRGGPGGSGGRGSSGSNSAISICRDFTSKGHCARGDQCNFHHVVQLHAQVNAAPKPPLDQSNASNYKGNNHYNNNNNYGKGNPNNRATVTSITIWEQPNNAPFKIFTASNDGYWRLWNTAGGQFQLEFEQNMNGKVNQCLVKNNFLFCGFETICSAIPRTPVGMLHAWNLQNPQQPPLELHVQPAPPNAPPNTPTISLPYAHNQAVTAVHMTGTDPTTVQIATGSHDGSIHLWAYRELGGFQLAKRLIGHAREVTGLVLLPTQNLLWSCGMDSCIRIWNTTTGDCQYCIPPAPPALDNPQQQQIQPQASMMGHSHVITQLLSFESSPGNLFILSSSLDRTVKAWNATTGECVASELHDEGVICMALARDMANNQLLLVGTESGTIQCRNLVQTAKMAAFQLLFSITSFYGVQHDGAVKCLIPGPSATFYSGGTDGMMHVFSFVGDLGIN